MTWLRRMGILSDLDKEGGDSESNLSDGGRF